MPEDQPTQHQQQYYHEIGFTTLNAQYTFTATQFKDHRIAGIDDLDFDYRYYGVFCHSTRPLTRIEMIKLISLDHVFSVNLNSPIPLHTIAEEKTDVI